MIDEPISTSSDDRRKVDETVSEAVVSAVADATGQSPLEIPPLVETIDPDALNALFRTANGSESGILVSFEYADCYVTVDGETVRVEVTMDGEQSQDSRKADS